ncbi:hypothetical protein A374_03354 [Fictibacillus macauensis ZFHKF-1]|uniref:Integral inner membrane protein n=1 Tax=Fictibacillus macauensis ZFHKF-1 TaxID=1196324 RepID=I8UI59_9BACL|nr:hypothetical protein [Fictibacillus macauensis]EIT86575.1 hypothetical protein A374_03354 [Fictibacillus macauensis ZFHKF-1]
MDGVLFYWISWAGFIYTTFLMKKQRNRTFFACLLLGVIIAEEWQLQLSFFSVHVSYIVLFLSSFYFLPRTSFWRMLYFVFTTCAIACAYAGLSLLAMYDPVWLQYGLKWGIPLFVVVLSLLFTNDAAVRVYSVLSGMLVGELLFQVTIAKLTHFIELGLLSYWDQGALAILALFSWQEASRLSSLFYRETWRLKNAKKAARAKV